MYKLKTTNNQVNFLLRTGRDLVKNSMSGTEAQKILNNGKVKKSTIKAYPINVDDKWFFEGEKISDKTEGNV